MHAAPRPGRMPTWRSNRGLVFRLKQHSREDTRGRRSRRKDPLRNPRRCRRQTARGAALDRIPPLAQEVRKPVYELLALEAESGLARLPEPSAGDIFLDFEADPFVENGGLEYLLGYVALNETGDPDYFSTWAFDRAAERHAFESFM